MWESLFSAVREACCLTSTEKLVLEHLWLSGTVKTLRYDDYPGDEVFAARVSLSARRLRLALRKLEAKGFIKPVIDAERGICAYLLNPLLIEDAYDRTKRDYPDLLAS